MTLKRAFLLLVLGLFAYLGLYTWNERTGVLNSLAGNAGLELIGTVMAPADWAVDGITDTWGRYVDLLNVREKHDILAERLENATALISTLQEDKNELARLQELMRFSAPEKWASIGARVIGARIGPLGALNSILIDKGFSNGALPGTPVVTKRGVVGQVMRSSPHFSTVILVSDPSCRIAVITQRTRVPGVIGGNGNDKPLLVHYVPPNAQIKIGEYLVTSGLDGLFPKGIPVAWVEKARPSDTSPFQMVSAWPLAHLNELEEVLLLSPPAGRREVPFNRFLDELPPFVEPPATNSTLQMSDPDTSISPAAEPPTSAQPPAAGSEAAH